jgi:hypothetical protein
VSCSWLMRFSRTSCSPMRSAAGAETAIGLGWG